jgi:hypothetical protein
MLLQAELRCNGGNASGYVVEQAIDRNASRDAAVAGNPRELTFCRS